jgi:CRISPR-associated endonuclease Cas1
MQIEQIQPRRGVVTLYGYGSKAYVKNGHLILEDGIGASRTTLRLSRIGHKLNRLVVIGSDGFVSFGALRWLADQNAAFVMLNRNGTVLATCGPVRSSDAHLKRAQALADYSSVGMQISHELIVQKLANQERVAREKLLNSNVANQIAQCRISVPAISQKKELLAVEAQAANAYWGAWKNICIEFPKSDLLRVPDHWRTFGVRISALTGSPRLAVNPANAILNYLYAVLESETRLAAAAVGLDVGLGFFHSDTTNRDSLACDLMEPVRPKVDAFLFDWISREPLKREWFFEQRDGNCRLMGSFAVKLSETASMWSNAVAPYVERIPHILWTRKRSSFLPPTPLTRNNKRKYVCHASKAPAKRTARIPALCRICGEAISPGSRYCVGCAPSVSKANLIEVAKRGRIATVSVQAQALRSATQRRQAAALKAWNPSNNPKWLNQEFYRERIIPRLKIITVPKIVSTLSVSEPYATNIRAGRCTPHPRHWLVLARLVGISPDK